jgi:outer membrane protein insertion porin family
MASRTTLALRVFYGCSLIFSSLNADQLAPRSAYEGQRIVNIRFDPPAQPVDSDDLNRLLTWKAGDELRLADVSAAIKRLYATGSYSSIDVDTEPVTGGVELVIRTTEQWFIGPVEVHGKVNPPPSQGQLASAAQLDLGQPFNDDDIQTALQGMRQLLERNGLYGAQITPKIERDPAHQEVSITFQLEAGKRARMTSPVIEGDTKLPAPQVAAAAKYKGWFRWRPATAANVQTGVRDILKKYGKKDRLTASVTLEKREYLAPINRIRPTIQANGGPVVKITAEEAKISKGTLKKYVPVFEEQSVNNDLLVSGARNLRDYFQFQGYFDVQVDFKITTPSPDRENIVYRIGLGTRHRVAAVAIKGAHYFRSSDIRVHLYTRTAGFIRLRHGRYSEDFAKRDEASISALYRDNGFRDVKVTASTVDNYQGRKGAVGVTFTIQEGPQFLVSAIEVNGLNLPQRSQILSQLSSAAGQPYSETNIASDRDYILLACQTAGYPNATFQSHSSPAPGDNQMSVQYDIAEGSLQTVRDVVITGLHETRQRLIKPSIQLKPGDPLSWVAMGDMQRKLYNLGVFEDVDMAIQDPDGDMQNKYVLYHLTESPRYSMAVGLGAQVARFGGSQYSLDSPSGTTGFAPDFDLELSRLNLWGLGQSLNFKGLYSTLDRHVSLEYLIPRIHNEEGRNLSFTALYDNTRDVLTYTATTYQGTLQYSKKLSKPSTLVLRYTWRDSVVNQDTLKINPLLIPLYSQPSHVAQIGASLIQDRRDDKTNPRSGFYNTVDIDLADDYFGGDKNFLRFLGRSSYYKTFHGVYTLASNTEFGVIKSFSLGHGFIPSTYIPLPDRFYGGGDSSDRAFPYDQAGPRDPLTGFPIGGNALLFHSTELRFPLIGDNIGGVVFHDMGNIYSGLSEISFGVHQHGLGDFDYMSHAVGFGVTYRTPLGPVRIDLAYSINPPTFNGLQGTYQQLVLNQATPAIQSVSHFQFFFTIGQAF